MIINGYAKQYRYTGTGELQIQVRIPNIHGPYSQKEYQGEKVRNYVQDQNLPWYSSLLLPHLPNDGEVVALTSTNEANNDWMVIGLTGGMYSPAGISGN